MNAWLATIYLLQALAAPTLAQQDAAVYKDPGGVFTLEPPEGWEVNRQEFTGQITYTTVATPEGEIEVETLAFPTTAPLTNADLEARAKEVITLIVGLLEEEGPVRNQQTTKATFAGLPAVRFDALLTNTGEGTQSRFRMYVVLGARHVVAAGVTAPEDDAAGFAQGEKVLTTMAVAGGQAGAALPATSRGGLARVAERIKAGFKPETADQVLVAGDPPLTEGSVQSFVQLLGVIFGAHLTESEIALTREQFVAFYQKSDDAGRATIAQTAGNILAGLQQGTPEQQAAAAQEVRGVFEDRLSAGAQAGIAWAKVLWEAVQRREEAVATTNADRPEFAQDAKLDNTLSEADVDASLEMLYFMWVASGRDPQAATPEVLAQVRQYLVANFVQFPPDLQYLLANAEKVYGDMRNAWAQAGPAEQQAYAIQFAQALDAFGLTAPGAGGGAAEGGGGGSAWDDVAGMSPSDISAGLVQTTCFNLAQKASGGW